MGIEGIDFLKPDYDPPAPQVRERKQVAQPQHIVEINEKKYVYGWDQQLLSFYLQVHDLTKDEDDDDRIPVWLGSGGDGPDATMYEVEQLVTAAQRYGLHIPHEEQVALYGEKDG